MSHNKYYLHFIALFSSFSVYFYSTLAHIFFFQGFLYIPLQIVQFIFKIWYFPDFSRTGGLTPPHCIFSGIAISQGCIFCWKVLIWIYPLSYIFKPLSLLWPPFQMTGHLGEDENLQINGRKNLEKGGKSVEISYFIVIFTFFLSTNKPFLLSNKQTSHEFCLLYP